MGREDLAQLDSYQLKTLSQEENNSRYQLCSDFASISVPAIGSVGKSVLAEEGEKLQGVLSGASMGQLNSV